MREHRTIIEFNGVSVDIRIGSYEDQIVELAILTYDDNGHELVHNADFLLTDEIVDSLVKLLREEG